MSSFDTIPHGELMQSVARRIVDRDVLHLIKMWLTVPVEERGEDGKSRWSGGKGSTSGTPQGGVISPLLANLYMNRFLKYWRMSRRGEVYRASIVNYADDFVILSCGHAAEAMEWTQRVLTKLKLRLNESKTSIRNARQERFDFLGYTFGPHCFKRNGHWYLGASPSKRSVQRLKSKVRDILQPRNVGCWDDVRDRLNRVLRGWHAYFHYGTVAPTYWGLERYVYDCVRRFLRRRHKQSSRGTVRFPDHVVFGRLGVTRLRTLRRGTLA